MIHFTLSICGISVFYGFLYQYCSIQGKAEIFHKIKSVILMSVSMIAYPLPSLFLWVWNVDWEEGRRILERTAPYAYNLYFEGACLINAFNLKTTMYFLVLILQIAFIYIFAVILAAKNFIKLSQMKESMSSNSMKARKQFLWALVLQLMIPFFFIFLPIVGLSIEVVFAFGNFEGMFLRLN